MLSIAKISGGREHYYTNEIATAKEDYYTAQKLSFEPAGVWIGKGAAQVGLAGKCQGSRHRAHKRLTTSWTV